MEIRTPKTYIGLTNADGKYKPVEYLLRSGSIQANDHDPLVRVYSSE